MATGCKSEYQERLEEARKLKEKILVIEESNFISPNPTMLGEIAQIQERIKFLAKVSGNEVVFMHELNY